LDHEDGIDYWYQELIKNPPGYLKAEGPDRQTGIKSYFMIGRLGSQGYSGG
jgi:hypothetical protein